MTPKNAPANGDSFMSGTETVLTDERQQCFHTSMTNERIPVADVAKPTIYLDELNEAAKKEEEVRYRFVVQYQQVFDFHTLMPVERRPEPRWYQDSRPCDTFEAAYAALDRLRERGSHPGSYRRFRLVRQASLAPSHKWFMGPGQVVFELPWPTGTPSELVAS